MTDTRTLLAEYAQNGSDAAFRELVERYVALVYSCALRLVSGDAHRAEDVAQTVFINLARKARALPEDVKLGGWLHRDTCFVAVALMRGERRRQSRERQAVEMNALQDNPEADFSLVAPILDEAINELGEADRTAILLRFFEQHDFRSVGQVLGSNEDAARMRVTRALEKLESLLKRRGVTASSGALAVVLSANVVQAAPVGLAATLSTTALAGTTLTIAATTATKTIAMTALQKTLITATIFAAIGTGVYEAREASNARGQVKTLQQDQAPLTQQIAQLYQVNSDATNRLTAIRNENEGLRKQVVEVPKLRGEISRLKRENERLMAELYAETNDIPSSIIAPPEEFTRVETYYARVQGSMTSGQTLITGGWSTATGKRTFCLVSPKFGFDSNPNQVSLQVEWADVSEVALSKFDSDLRALKSETLRSSTALVLDETAAANLRKRFEQSDGVDFLMLPVVLSADGKQAEASIGEVKVIGGTERKLGPQVSIVPKLSAKHDVVDLSVSAELVLGRTGDK